MKLTFTLIILCFSLELMAQKAGTLDSSFGVDGKVLTAFNNQSSVVIYHAITQPDGKIITVGDFTSDDTTLASGFLAIRYTANGLLDSTFGQDGKAVIVFDDQDDARALGAAIQSDGKIILDGVGNKGLFSVKYSGLIARLNTNGTLDLSFGEHGIIETRFSKSREGYTTVALQTDGKIVAAGYTNNNTGLISCFSENGILDSTFGKNGYIITQQYIHLNDCKIQTDGKIVLCGDYQPVYYPEYCMQRYLSNGSLDIEFGNQGTVSLQPNPAGNQFNALSFQSDGKIVATGVDGIYSPNRVSYFGTARFDIQGRLDSTFGTNGIVITAFGDSLSFANSVLISKEDEIFLGGEKALDSAGDYALIKLTKDGKTDSLFGQDGKVTTDFGYVDGITSLMFQQNGKIVAAGETMLPPVYYGSLARYNNDGETKKQIIIQKIKHYIQTHNAQATTLNNVFVYPNPAQSILHIQGLSSNAKLTVVDLSGSITLSSELRAMSGVYNLNIASLHAGNYLLKIETNGEVVTKQFVKE